MLSSFAQLRQQLHQSGPRSAVVAAETLALLLSAACLVGKRKKYGYA